MLFNATGTNYKVCPSFVWSFQKLSVILHPSNKPIIFMESNKSGALVITNHDDLIKNPMLVLENMGGLTQKQGRIVLRIIEQLQARIADHLDNIGTRKANGQYSLFSDEDLDQNGTKVFFIEYAELGVHPSDYDKVDEAAEALGHIIVPVITENERGDAVKRWVQMFTTGVLLDKRERYKHRKSYFEIGIPRDIAMHITNMRSGYSEHLKSIYTYSRSTYAAHFLNLMYKWFRESNVKTISYKELRRITRMEEYDNKGNIVTERYTKFKDFKKRVLDPAKNDADRMWREGKTHFTFDYSLSYKGTRSTGTPDEIIFRMNQVREVAAASQEQPHVQLSASFLKVWERFVSLAGERVGEDTVRTWCSQPEPLTITRADKDGVVLQYKTRVACGMANDKVFSPCVDIWKEVFRDVPMKYDSSQW